MLSGYDELRVADWFSGCGGTSQGIAAVPGCYLTTAINHDRVSIASHQANFPHVQHKCTDVRKLDLRTVPPVDLAHYSPSCPPFSGASGRRRNFDCDTQTVLWETETEARVAEETIRGRLLMHEVVRHLDYAALRGHPVIAGTVENVVEARRWGNWHRWVARIRGLRYKTRLIALNSMHVTPVKMPRAPQSRDRLYLAFWHEKLGRDPDFDRWLRPRAWCPVCQESVQAIQVFKRPGADMGRYGPYGQYWYRCPHRSCRNAILDPAVLPAAAAIDWTVPGVKIGERVDRRGYPKPLKPKTIARIQAGIERYYLPVLSPAGGTWRREATPVTLPMPARTTRDNDTIAVPPGFIMRNNGSKRDGGEHCTPLTEPLRTLTTKGHQSLVAWDLIVPYYTKGNAQPAALPLPTVPTRDRFALARGDRPDIDIHNVEVRMLLNREIQAGMGFQPAYIVRGTGKQVKRQLGNAVTPCAGEVLYYPIASAVLGVDVAA